MSSLIWNEPVTVTFALPSTYVRALMTGISAGDSTPAVTHRIAMPAAARIQRLRDGRIKTPDALSDLSESTSARLYSSPPPAHNDSDASLGRSSAEGSLRFITAGDDRCRVRVRSSAAHPGARCLPVRPVGVAGTEDVAQLFREPGKPGLGRTAESRDQPARHAVRLLVLEPLWQMPLEHRPCASQGRGRGTIGRRCTTRDAGRESGEHRCAACVLSARASF